MQVKFQTNQIETADILENIEWFASKSIFLSN